MYSIFYEDLATRLYPSSLLHSYGVNGKISGSVAAVGEIGGCVAAVLHAPLGCAYHYRYSARRRHQPFYSLMSSNLTQQDIIFGTQENLLEAVRDTWKRYHPQLIFIIPSPVSDILSEDLRGAAAQLQKEGIPVVAVQSELFSHRDKNYSRNRLKELARQKITGDNRLEMELKGCGFTEVLYALVEQVMEPQEVLSSSINIETVGWGSEGRMVLREMEAFLKTCGISVNTWIPSAEIEDIRTAPKAQLNLVKRVRWARKMKEVFGTDYLHLGGSGRYVGLEGIVVLYWDIAKKLDKVQEMEKKLTEKVNQIYKAAEDSLAYLAKQRCVLVCRDLSSAPFLLKLYAKSFGVGIRAVCLILTKEQKRSLAITKDVEQQLLERIQEAISLYAPGVAMIQNPSREEMQELFSSASALIGTNDFTLEGYGMPLIPAETETTSLSFESWLRNVKRLERRLRNARNRERLLLNRLPFQEERFNNYDNESSRSAREMWQRMWLEKKEAE